MPLCVALLLVSDLHPILYPWSVPYTALASYLYMWMRDIV